MHRIDTATKAVDLFGPGKHGFKDGNPLTGDPSTTLNASLFNHLQEEIARAIEASGQALDASKYDQLTQAIRRLGAPAGEVSFFACAAPPAGWLKANGAAVSRVTYGDLFAAIGTTYGVGDGTTTFNVPDLRGEFVRGLDDGRNVDAGRTLGSAQGDAIKSHSHTAPTATSSSPGGLYEVPPPDVHYPSYDYEGGAPTSSTGDTETRPRNVALVACIRY